jgi:two-component system CheB/CheR fusion protein
MVSPRSRWLRYGMVPVTVAVAILLRWLFWPVIGAEIPFLFLWPAVFVCAWFGGYGPGMLATALAACGAALLFFSPPGSFGLPQVPDLVGLLLFLLLGSCISLVTDSLVHAHRNLAEAARRKDEFLAMLGHELRNPLAPIRNALYILRLTPASATARENAQDVIERQVGHMVRLVDDLLDVSRVTRGKIELRLERVDLAALLHRAVETARPLIDAQGHQLHIALPAEPIWLDADPTRITQVVANLLNNAAKYTEPGGQIWVSAARADGLAVIRVKDNGTGIAPDILPHVFEMFIQADDSLARSQGGLGIGLTLVKRLVQLHGGTVEAISAGLGKGSEFILRLPAAPMPVRVPLSKNPEGPSSPGPAARRVLVVDDNVDTSESLAQLIRLAGHEVTTAANGAAGLEKARSFHPDVVLLDIGLPGMDGYEVARRLREQSRPCAPLLVAVTGYGQPEDCRRAAAAGFDRHVVKPVDWSTIAELLADPNTAHTRAHI